MPTQEDIAHQQKLLATHRRNVKHYLQQQAQLGEAYAPPMVANGILEGRENIQRIKQILRGWNVRVDDLPDDGDAPATTAQESPTQPPAKPVGTAINRAALRQILIKHFSDSELRDLMFDMNVDYESLPGDSKSDKARELVAYAERRSRYDELVQFAMQTRPDISW